MECSICGGTKYTDALKQYNEGKPAWCIPRKGTKLHEELLQIMNAPKKPTRKLRKAPAQAPVEIPAQVPAGKKRVSKPIDPEVAALQKKGYKKFEISKETVDELEKRFNGSVMTFELDKSGAYFLTMSDGQNKTIMKDFEPTQIVGEYFIYKLDGYLKKYIINILFHMDTYEARLDVSKSMAGTIRIQDFEVIVK